MKFTGLVLTVMFIIAGIFDLYMLYAHGLSYTISYTLQTAALEAPLVVFVFGFLAGHIFGYMKPKPRRYVPYIDFYLQYKLHKHDLVFMDTLVKSLDAEYHNLTPEIFRALYEYMNRKIK